MRDADACQTPGRNERRSGAPIGADEPLKAVKTASGDLKSGNGTTVKLRSFVSPPRVAAAPQADEAPVVRKMTPAPEIVGKPLTDDGVEVRPMTQQEQPEGTLLDDGVQVKLMKDPNDEGVIKPRALKRPPARQTYMGPATGLVHSRALADVDGLRRHSPGVAEGAKCAARKGVIYDIGRPVWQQPGDNVRIAEGVGVPIFSVKSSRTS